MREPFASLIRPEPAPSVPPFDRLAPGPPLNLLAAQIEALSSPGDAIVDLHGRGGWVGRTAIARLRRAYTFESNPLTRLLAEVVLRPPDLRHLDAAFQGIASAPRGELPLKPSLAALYASRCATCGRVVTVDEFLWDGDAAAPFRKSYHCAYCRDQVGGGELRTAATDAGDAQRSEIGDERDVAYAALRERFPVLDGQTDLVRQVLALYTPRTLVALHAILQRIEGDLRAASLQAALRIAFLHVLLPASRLNGYPGRVAALRISGARVRLPASRQWRERNPWLLFEDGIRLVRGFIQRLGAAPGGPIQARLGEDLLALADASANVVIRRGSPGTPGAVETGAGGGPLPRVRLVATQPPLRWSTESLSFAYLGAAMALGREAAGELPLEPLFGSVQRQEWGWHAAALRRSLAAVRPILARDARALIVLDPGGPEAIVAAALGGVGAGFHLTSVQLSEGEEGIGGTIELSLERPRSEAPRTRANVPLPSLERRTGEEHDAGAPFQLADVERTIADVAVAVLQARGEPARFERLLAEILVGLDAAGHLRRLVGTRTYRETADAAEARADASGLLPRPAEPDLAEEPGTGRDATSGRELAAGRDVPGRGGRPRAEGADQVALLLDLVRGELSRPENRRLVEIEPERWWLADRRDLARATIPLADRVEWAVFSLLSTSGRLSEAALYERIAGIFRGADSPEEALVRACLDSYRSLASTPEALRTNDELQARYAEHTAIVADIIGYGHRLGLRAWASRAEQKRIHAGRPLADLLTERERRAYLPLIIHAPIEALEAVDVIWYLRGKVTFLFEVEWTAMLGEPLLQRGMQIPPAEGIVRFLVVVPERTELVRAKLDRSPVLRAALETGNWHILKSNHLRRLVEREGADLERLQPLLGLDPEIETAGEQLPLFTPAQPPAPHGSPTA